MTAAKKEEPKKTSEGASNAAVKELTGKSNPGSKCDPMAAGYVSCRNAENKAAASAKTGESAKKEKKTYKKQEFKPPTASGNPDMECSMDGYVKMTKEVVENVLIVFALAKETLAVMLPREALLIVKLTWDGMVGVNNWVGFLVASLYYVALENSFGDVYCDIFGYGYYAIYYMNYIVAFAGDGGASSGEKNDAAAVALAKSK